METLMSILTWKVGFFVLLGVLMVLHVANSLAVLQLVEAIEGKESKRIPRYNRWKLITILPLAALYYSLEALILRWRKKK